MLFTLFYVYATAMQWWRLRSLRSKLSGTLNAQNALLVCSGHRLHEFRKQRSLENLLFKYDNRIACTVVPRQKVNLCQWIAFPKNLRFFPIYIGDYPVILNGDKIYLVLQAVLDNYVKHHSEIIQLENFCELVGWKATDFFEVVVRTDLSNLAKLVNIFAQNNVDINHELNLLKMETIDVEGMATTIKYEKTYLKEHTLKYSYLPVHWKTFVTEMKDLYSKNRDFINPKIKIENGSPKSSESPPPKALKKDFRKHIEDRKNADLKSLEVKKEPKKSSEDRNTLDVSTSDHKRHKGNKSEKKTKSRSEISSKVKHKATDGEPPKQQAKREHKRTANKLVKQSTVKETEPEEKIVEQGGAASLAESPVKPPNVLVYSDSLVTKDNVKRILYSILNKEKYVIYDMPTSANQNSWNASTVLVVVCGTVPPSLTNNLIQYYLSGGQLLCLCSDLMYSILHTFATAEVREHELVRFSYGTWERVKMMHHIFCYQASPAKKQFSRDSDHSNHSSNGSSPLAPRTPSNVELRHNDKDYNIQVQVLGTEETWQTPSLLLAKVKSSKGRGVFSQVHLEIDPEVYENDEEKYRSLLSSNEARIDILKDILSTHLELVCDENFGNVEYSAGYFLGRYDAKMDMISNCENITQNQLTCDKISVIFCGHNVSPGAASNIRLPILIHSCPSNFSTVDYFETLDTEDIGRLVIYTDILTSSQHLLSKKLRHGLVVISRQQTNGIGRSKNTWLSPMGCASFSLQMHIPLESPMGKHLSLIQHLVMVAIVSALKKLEGYEILNIAIKWPNDLYADSSVKIGGVIVNSLILPNLSVVNIGCGVNLSNQNPTTCINDMINRINVENNINLKPISYEKFFAIVFNEVERLYKDVQANGIDDLVNLYLQYWLHRDAEVTVQIEKKETKAKVVGIDAFGFLMIQSSDGTVTTVQPDGNSFDMMSGLIAPKTF